jgi:DNA-binding MarR family transcriptional regulator
MLTPPTARMDDAQKLDLIRQFMGAANVFCSAVDALLEETVDEATDGTLATQQIKLMLFIARPGQRFKVMDIASFLNVTNAAASRAVDRLVQRGLIDRTIAPDDRRAVDLALTAEGHELLAKFAEVRNGRLMTMLGDVPPDLLQRLLQLLDDVAPRLIDVGGDDDRCVRCGIDARANCVLRDMMGHRCSAVEPQRA